MKRTVLALAIIAGSVVFACRKTYGDDPIWGDKGLRCIDIKIRTISTSCPECKKRLKLSTTVHQWASCADWPFYYLICSCNYCGILSEMGYKWRKWEKTDIAPDIVNRPD